MSRGIKRTHSIRMKVDSRMGLSFRIVCHWCSFRIVQTIVFGCGMAGIAKVCKWEVCRERVGWAVNIRAHTISGEISPSNKTCGFTVCNSCCLCTFSAYTFLLSGFCSRKTFVLAEIRNVMAANRNDSMIF